MTLLSGAARTPTKRKSAQQYFKSNGADFKAKGSRVPLNNSVMFGFGYPISCIHAVEPVGAVVLQVEALIEGNDE